MADAFKPAIMALDDCIGELERRREALAFAAAVLRGAAGSFPLPGAIPRIRLPSRQTASWPRRLAGTGGAEDDASLPLPGPFASPPVPSNREPTPAVGRDGRRKTAAGKRKASRAGNGEPAPAAAGGAREKVLAALAGGPRKRTQIEAATGLNGHQLTYLLPRLIAAGMVVAEGRSRARRYMLPPGEPTGARAAWAPARPFRPLAAEAAAIATDAAGRPARRIPRGPEGGGA